MMFQFMVNIVTDTVEDLWKHITEGVKIFILTDVKYCLIAVGEGGNITLLVKINFTVVYSAKKNFHGWKKK